METARTPALLYRGKRVRRAGDPRRGVSAGLGVAPEQDWRGGRAPPTQADNARTMGRFVVVEKTPSEAELNRWGSRKSLSGWDQNASVLSTASMASVSDEQRGELWRHGSSARATRRKAHRGRHPGIITGTARTARTMPGSPQNVHSGVDRGTGEDSLDVDLHLQFMQTEGPSAGANVAIVDTSSGGRGWALSNATAGSNEKYIGMYSATHDSPRASTAGASNWQPQHHHEFYRLRPGFMGRSAGLSKVPPRLGYRDFEHKARIRRPYTTQKMNTRELVGKSFVGFTRSQRAVVPSLHNFNKHSRYFDGVGKERAEVRRREYADAGAGHQQERQLDEEKELRRNAEKEERAALVNDFKIGVPSSPFKRPAVLLSPRLAHSSTGTEGGNREDEADMRKPVDMKLRAGLSGRGVFHNERPALFEDNRRNHHHQNNLDQHGKSYQRQLSKRESGRNKVAKSKMYSGQLFRGALMPANTRWMPEDAGNLSVGSAQQPHQLEGDLLRQQLKSPRYQKRPSRNSVPVGFFSRKRALAPPRQNRPSISSSRPFELLISGGK